MGSKIEGSLTGPPDINVSYVDGFSVPITCSSEGVAVSSCNIDLYKKRESTIVSRAAKLVSHLYDLTEFP